MRSLFLVVCLLLVASSAPAQVVEESLSRDPGPLDFIQGEGYEQWIFQALAGDALVGLDPKGEPVPRLANRFNLLKDGRISFTLRSDVHFPDGSPLRPEDVLWTFQELLRNPKASPTKRAIFQGAAVGLDEGRLWIRSPKPPARLLMELARVPIAQANHPERGCGPFAFRQEPGAWVFSRRNHFLNPQVEGIRFRLLADPGAVQSALQKGWLSIGAPMSRRQTEVPPTHRLITQPMHAQQVVWSRLGPAPLRWLERWRKDAFPSQLLALNARPSRGLWPETLGFKSQAIAIQGPLPKPAGPLTLLYVGGNDTIEKLLLALRERARQDGVDLRLQPLEEGLLMARLQKGDFQLACATAIFDPHPWAVLEYLDPQGPMNFSGWSDARAQSLIPKLTEPGTAGWRTLQGHWAEHPAALPLLDIQSVIWVDRRLQVEPSVLGLYLHTPGAAGWRWLR